MIGLMKAITPGVLVGTAAFLIGFGLTVATSTSASSPCRPVDAIYLELVSEEVDGVEVTTAPANPISEVSAIYGSDLLYVNQVDDTQLSGLRSVVVRPEGP